METITLLPLLVLLFFLALIGIVLARRVRLPGLVGMLLVGIVLKMLSVYLNLEIFKAEQMNELAKIGVTFLLFLLGIELNFKSLKKIRVLIILGAGLQVVLTTLLGTFLLKLVGISGVSGIIIAVCLSLSSTAVTVKLLSERGTLQSNSSRLLIGWLLVQDLMVIPISVLLPFVDGRNDNFGIKIGWVAGLLAVVVILSLCVSKIFDLLVKLGEKEALVLAAAILGLGLGLLFERAGLGLALGGFVAGMILSESSEKHEIYARLSALHDLFAGIFFLSLGFLISPAALFNNWKIILLLVGCFGLIKFTVSIIELLFWGIHLRVSVGVALGLFETGEFAFVIGQSAFSRGILSGQELTILTSVVVISMIIVPLVLAAENLVYSRLLLVTKSWLSSGKKVTAVDDEEMKGHTILLGYGRVGKLIGEKLWKKLGKKMVVVDYDLDLVEQLKGKGVNAYYGDVLETEVLAAVKPESALTLIVTIPETKIVKSVIRHVKKINPKIYIMARAHRRRDMEDLKKDGADRVVLVEESVGRLMYSYIKSKV